MQSSVMLWLKLRKWLSMQKPEAQQHCQAEAAWQKK